jgi:hypothetical protein
MTFNKAIANTEESAKLNLQGISVPKRELIVSFARKIPDMDDSDLEAIREILDKEG